MRKHDIPSVTALRVRSLSLSAFSLLFSILSNEICVTSSFWDMLLLRSSNEDSSLEI